MHPTKKPKLNAFALLAALALTAPFCRGDIEAVQIHLNTSSGLGERSFTVPEGKILIIEHILFNDTWEAAANPMEIIIRHSTNPSGPVWNTTQTYSSQWNQLLRPLKLPEGKAVSVPFLDEILYKAFIYGSLVEPSDLYARVSTDFEDSDVTPASIDATVKLASARPSKVTVSTSKDMVQWAEDTAAEVAPIGPKTKSISVDYHQEESRLFVKTEARARPSELPPIFLRPVPSLGFDD